MNTSKPHKHLMLATALVTILAATSAFAADGDKSKIKGLITGVNGNTLTVKDGNNAEQTINVSADTKLKKTKGLTGVIHSKVEPGALIPGLPISADVVAAGSGFNATEISFKSEDFKTAQQVQAGVAPTSAVAAANAARMDDFGTYEALATTEVLFASGSTTISAKGKSDLDALAAKAKETKNYQVVLQGFTDSTGNAEANQRLSTHARRRRVQLPAAEGRPDAGPRPRPGRHGRCGRRGFGQQCQCAQGRGEAGGRQGRAGRREVIATHASIKRCMNWRTARTAGGFLFEAARQSSNRELLESPV